MAKLTDRTELTTPADGDLYVTTDVSDTTDAATGTDKKITWANIKATLKTYFDTLYAGALGADDNYVTDAEKVKLSNLSGTNTGDQDLTSYLTSATAASTYEPLKGSDDNYVTDAEKAALHTHSNKAVLDAITASFTTADETKLDAIEALADVTDATKVSAAGAAMISSGAGAPSSTPAKVGNIYIDTTNDNAYIAVGTASSADWEISNDGAGGGISDGDKGDITVSASGATWTIDNGVVSLAKMADIATSSLIYRKTAGTGVPEVNTLATLKADLGLTGTNSGDQTSIVDITGTKAEFDAAVTDGNIMFDGDSITNATANTHKVFYSDGSGVITELALGADGTFLKSNGASSAPSFATPAGSGDVSKVGTPVNNQIGVWTGDGTIEGDTALTFDTTTDTFSVDSPTFVVDGANNRVGIGTAAPSVRLHSSDGVVPAANAFIGTEAFLGSASSSTLNFRLFNTSATSTTCPFFVMLRARGTADTPTVVQSGDGLGAVSAQGWDGTTRVPSGSITFLVDGTPGASDMPGRIVFSTTADGAAAVTDRIIIDSAGALKPATNDGSALGNTTNQFSDLFLAEGAVINWDNGDATITQTGSTITVAGITALDTGTSTALTTGTIELGAASDTTISRSSAGVLAVEGVVIPTVSSTSTLTNKTLTAPVLTGTTTADRIDYDRAVGGVNAIGNLGATETIDWSTHTHYTGTLDSNITFTYSNQVSGQSITLYLSYDGTAQRTITWPTTTWLDNDSGAAPTAPAASGNVLVVTLQYIGTTVYGSATGNYAVYA